jgi:hypothetical protein
VETGTLYTTSLQRSRSSILPHLTFPAHQPDSAIQLPSKVSEDSLVIDSGELTAVLDALFRNRKHAAQQPEDIVCPFFCGRRFACNSCQEGFHRVDVLAAGCEQGKGVQGVPADLVGLAHGGIVSWGHGAGNPQGPSQRRLNLFVLRTGTAGHRRLYSSFTKPSDLIRLYVCVEAGQSPRQLVHDLLFNLIISLACALVDTQVKQSARHPSDDGPKGVTGVIWGRLDRQPGISPLSRTRMARCEACQHHPGLVAEGTVFTPPTPPHVPRTACTTTALPRYRRRRDR